MCPTATSQTPPHTDTDWHQNLWKRERNTQEQYTQYNFFTQSHYQQFMADFIYILLYTSVGANVLMIKKKKI